MKRRTPRPSILKHRLHPRQHLAHHLPGHAFCKPPGGGGVRVWEAQRLPDEPLSQGHPHWRGPKNKKPTWASHRRVFCWAEAADDQYSFLGSCMLRTRL